jgi:hypothetical protein
VRKPVLCPLIFPSLLRVIGAEVASKSAESLVWAERPPRLLWNMPSIKHRRNELYLRVTEQLTVRRPSSNHVIHSSVTGLVKLIAYLSDYPHLEIEVEDYMLSSSFSPSFTSVLPHPLSSHTFLPLDDGMMVSLHSSLSIVSTVPFLLQQETLYSEPFTDLMSYSVTGSPSSSLLSSLLSCRVTISSLTSYKVTIRSASHFLLQNVTVQIPLQSHCIERVDTHLLVDNGSAVTVKWLPERDCIEWKLPMIVPHRDYSFSLLAFSSQSLSLLVLSPVTAQFTIAHQLLSNRMKITRLRLRKIPLDYRYRIDYHCSTRVTEYQMSVEYRDQRERVTETDREREVERERDREREGRATCL